MRDAPYLHAKHLDEAVRQQVITSAQREALDALARTMKPDGGRALPELAWFRWMPAAVVAGTVGFFGLFALVSARTMLAHQALAGGLLAVGVCAGGAAMLRDRREHVLVKGVLAAGATAFAWLLGAGAALAAFDVDNGSGDRTSVEFLPFWTIPGSLAVLAAAVAFGRWLRAPTVTLPAGLALAHIVVRVGSFLNLSVPYQRGSRVAWDAAAQLPWWLGAFLALVVAARLLDRRFPRGSDPSFWVHLVAPGVALVGALKYTEHAFGGIAALATLLWCGSFALAFAWRRIAWAAWGALGLAVIPLENLNSGRSNTPAIIAWVPLCIAVFALVAVAWRRHVLATVPADGDERLLWG